MPPTHVTCLPAHRLAEQADNLLVLQQQQQLAAIYVVLPQDAPDDNAIIWKRRPQAGLLSKLLTAEAVQCHNQSARRGPVPHYWGLPQLGRGNHRHIIAWNIRDGERQRARRIGRHR